MPQAEVVITNEIGLHARPSVKLTKLAKGYVAAIQVAVADEGPWVDAKSIVKVMAAKVPKGATLFIRAQGDDADAAVSALVELVRRNFDEGSEHAGAI